MNSPAGACAGCRDLQALIDAVSPLITSLADRITPDNAMTPQASMVRNAAHALAKAKRATCASPRRERKGCGDPECGCDAPIFTEPLEALRFLSGRLKYAGVSHVVAETYARDIDAILDQQPAAGPK